MKSKIFYCDSGIIIQQVEENEKNMTHIGVTHSYVIEVWCKMDFLAYPMDVQVPYWDIEVDYRTTVS